MRVEFSDDENIVRLFNMHYVAVPGSPGSCGTCVMKDGFSCRLKAAALVDAVSFTKADTSRCSPVQRKDGRDITWQRG